MTSRPCTGTRRTQPNSCPTPPTRSAFRPRSLSRQRLSANTDGRFGGVGRVVDPVALVAGRGAAAAGAGGQAVSGARPEHLGVGRTWAGDLAGAAADLVEAEAQAVELGLGLTVVSARSYLSVLDALHGRLRQAHRRATSVRAAVDRRGWAAEPQALGAYVALALTFFARNRLDEASDVIDAGLTAGTRGADPDAVCCWVSQRWVLPPPGVTWRQCARRPIGWPPNWPQCPTHPICGPVVRAGAVPGAADLRSSGPGGDDGSAGSGVRLCRCGRKDCARPGAPGLGRTELLPELLSAVIESGASFLGLVVEARILLALAADREHRDTAALTQLTEAIDLAEPESMIRPFLDAGPPLRSLIVRHRHIVARHLDFTQDTHSPGSPRRRGNRPVRRTSHRTGTHRPALSADDAQGRGNRRGPVRVDQHGQGAPAVYLPKLDVTSRRAAVERARELNLL